jgi:hypothetical protein
MFGAQEAVLRTVSSNSGSRPAAKNGLHTLSHEGTAHMTKQKGARGEHCDMLVIGNLLGGSVAALELTEKGDSLRISAVWRKRYNKGVAEKSWDIERFAWPPRGRKGIQHIYWLAKVMVHAGVGTGSRLLRRIRNSRPSTNGARTASTDSESAASMPTASSRNTMATIYSIATRPRWS